MRRPRRPSTQEARRVTLDLARALLDEGPEAVTVEGLAGISGRSVAWIYAYLGGREALLADVIRAEQARCLGALASLPREQPQKLLRRVLACLVPSDHPRAALWAFELAPREAWNALAQAIAQALGPDLGRYQAGIGGGILGVLTDALHQDPGFTRRELLKRAEDMLLAVLLFRLAAERRGRGLV